MPFFADSEQLYAVSRTLLTRVQEKEPEATTGISSSHLIIRLKARAPSAEFTLNGRKRPVQITYGPSRQRPHWTLNWPPIHCIIYSSASYL